MSALRRALKLAGGAVLGLLLALALAFGLLQTGPGKAWLAQRVGGWLSSPAERVTITGIGGLVPFDMRVAKIELADAQGPRVAVADAVLAIAPADLLAGSPAACGCAKSARARSASSAHRRGAAAAA